MSSDLRVDFQGLVSLVPMKKAEEPGEASKWIAALVDLGKTTIVPSKKKPSENEKKSSPTIAPHVACVIVPDDAVIDVWSTKAPALVFESEKTHGQRLRLYVLNSQGLKLEYAGKTGLRAAAKAQGKSPQSAEAQDLAWVAPLNQMGLPGAEVFDAALIDKDGLPADPAERHGGTLPGLAGLVEIESGSLGVDDVVRDLGNGTPLQFQFKPVPEGVATPHTQAQGNQIVLLDRIAGETLRLLFRRRNPAGSAIGQPISEQVILRPGSEGLHLRVANLELEVILNVGHPFGGMQGLGVFPDPDFAVHYLLSKYWSDFPVLPVPTLVGTKDSPLGGSTRETCKAGRFAGLSE